MAMSTLSASLAAEIEAVAARLGLSPSTVGKRIGQGGRFYMRLKAGNRIWPETDATARQRLRELEAAKSDAA